jgi:DNA-binding CsgD family transcriptional regulator
MRARALTPAETHVATLVAAGRSTLDVATELGLSRNAVEWHLARACRELGVHTPAELVPLFAKGPSDERRSFNVRR